MATVATLGEIAERFGLELRGDADHRVNGVCTLANGRADGLAFLANKQYKKLLADSAAGVVILAEHDAEEFAGNKLLSRNPYLDYARVATFLTADDTPAVIHPAAHVDASAKLGANCAVSAGAVIEADVVVGDNCQIGANAVLCSGIRLGDRCKIAPGAVIGSRGFGMAPSPQGWVDVPQVGSVRIGNDVEIGANTTIDRGALDDTVIGNGVKIDNQVQIAHNCVLGDHTAVAGTVGIAGSTTFGQRCMIGGACMVSGHLTVCDDVVLTGGTMLTRDISKPGMYSGGWPATPNADWRKQVARLRRLDQLSGRVSKLESASRSDNDDAS